MPEVLLLEPPDLLLKQHHLLAQALVLRLQALEALGLLLQTAVLLVRKLQARNKLGILCQQILHVLEGLEHVRILTCFASAMHQLTC